MSTNGMSWNRYVPVRKSQIPKDNPVQDCALKETIVTSMDPTSNPNEGAVETYRIGDYCYFETSASGPYQIRRLDEFIKNGNGIDAKVFVYSRKCDLPEPIQKQFSGFVDGDEDFEKPALVSADRNPLTDCRKRRRLKDYSEEDLLDHWISSREVFLNKDTVGPVIETLPTSLIRGKCDVLNHIDGLPKKEFVGKEHTFFFERTWYPPEFGQREPGQLIKDREKRIHYDKKGTFQAAIPVLLAEAGRTDYERKSDRSVLCWRPNCIAEETVEHFVQVTVAVGLMARCVAATNSTSVASQELPYTVARLAGRDNTHSFAMELLHRYGYSLQRAINALVGNDLRYKQSLLETFDERDMAYFTHGLHETLRSLQRIHSEWMPWRKFSDIVCFYYLFKCTAPYKEFQDAKIKERKERGVITSVNIRLFDSRACVLKAVPPEQSCYSCDGTSKTWYAWVGLSRFRGQVHPVCSSCWHFWKYYGALKRPWKRGSKPKMVTRNTLIVHKGSKIAIASSSKPHLSTSASKPLLLTHRSPLPPEEFNESFDDEEKLLAEQEFEYIAQDHWLLARRVASESLYTPKQMARCSDFAFRDMGKVKEYYHSCPPFVVNYYKRNMGRKKVPIEDVVSKIRTSKLALIDDECS